MSFQLLPLPYRPDSLGKFMSAETIEYHHGQHHRAYVAKTNKLVSEQGIEGRSLVEVIRAAHDRGDRSLFNNSAQFWNHNFFWQCLAPPNGQQPSGKLAAMIEDAFGGTEALLAKLTEEATSHFSNGWVWLVLDGDKLRVTSLHDADTPLIHEGMKPLMTLDVWEHAYYIDYRHARPTFAEQVLANLVNWEFVAGNLDGGGDRRGDQQS